MNSVLLDTCSLLQWARDPRLLKDEARITIANGRSQVFISAASAWEIAIKVKLGKLERLPSMMSFLKENRFIELPILITHTEETASLPMIHRDPFDRLLVAQARCNLLTIVTSDAEIQKYEVATLAA